MVDTIFKISNKMILQETIKTIIERKHGIPMTQIKNSDVID